MAEVPDPPNTQSTVDPRQMTNSNQVYDHRGVPIVRTTADDGIILPLDNPSSSSTTAASNPHKRNHSGSTPKIGTNQVFEPRH